MTAEVESYSGADFKSKLQRDEIPSHLVFTGRVKKAEDDDKTLLFAPGIDGENWTPVPIELIDKVHLLGHVPWGDYLVSLHLKEPQSPNEQLFVQLARLAAVEQSQAARRLLSGTPAQAAGLAEQQRRQLWREQIGLADEEPDLSLVQASVDIDTILDRIDQGIAAERVAMDRLIERMVSRAQR